MSQPKLMHSQMTKEQYELFGLWEQLHNPDFKAVEFDRFMYEAGIKVIMPN